MLNAKRHFSLYLLYSWTRLIGCRCLVVHKVFFHCLPFDTFHNKCYFNMLSRALFFICLAITMIPQYPYRMYELSIFILSYCCEICHYKYWNVVSIENNIYVSNAYHPWPDIVCKRTRMFRFVHNSQNLLSRNVKTILCQKVCIFSFAWQHHTIFLLKTTLYTPLHYYYIQT